MRPGLGQKVKQQLSAVRRIRASGGSVTPWLASLFAKGAGRVADRLHASYADESLTAALSVSTKLNFGCGYDKRPGHLNVDSDLQCAPDVLISAQSMAAFPTAFYEHIVAKDVLEHLPRALSWRLLLRFSDWLRPDGVLELQTSSILGVARLLEKQRDFDHQFGMVTCLFGNQAHPGDFHLTGFTDITLKVMLLASGFEFGDFDLIDGWMFRVDARKKRTWFEFDRPMTDQAFQTAVFSEALGRAPQPHEVEVFDQLVRTEGRRAAALEIFASHEHLRQVAQAHGFL